MIETDTYHQEINEGYGWSILQAKTIGKPAAYLCNHAFISEGHLILYWNSQDKDGFRITHNE